MALFGFGRKKKDDIAALERELGLSSEIGKVPETKLDEALKPETFPVEPEKPAFKEFKEEIQVKEVQKEEPKHDIHIKDLELISAKLDSIRLMIDNMNERLKHIERMEEEEAKRRRTW